MDIATILGIIGALLVLVLAIGFGSLTAFIDLPSVYIVICGACGSTIAAYPASKLLNLFAVIKNAFLVKQRPPTEVVKQIVDFAEQARREGILALESRALEITDEYMKQGIQLAVDGTEPDLIREILSTEISYMENRHSDGAKMLEYLASMGPSFGMLGTVVGLVKMLGNMSDLSTLGPSMAVALITTFYGSILANAVCLPMAEKLKGYSRREVLLKELMLEGIMALQSGDNPRIVEQKLTVFLEPALRAKVTKEKS